MEVITITIIATIFATVMLVVVKEGLRFKETCLFKYLNLYSMEQTFRWNKEMIPKIFEQILEKTYLEETKKYLLKLYFNLISISTTHIHDLYQQG